MSNKTTYYCDRCHKELEDNQDLESSDFAYSGMFLGKDYEHSFDLCFNCHHTASATIERLLRGEKVAEWTR